MSNPFVWFDHRSDDPSGSGAFYEKLLDWKPASQAPPGMIAFAEGEQPWSGMTPSEDLPTGWLPYVAVDDLDASASKAEKLGATHYLLKPVDIDTLERALVSERKPGEEMPIPPELRPLPRDEEGER